MTKAYACALRLLAKRDHGAYELREKLLKKGYGSLEIQAAIAECQRLNLQSDKHFAKQVCRWRINQGYGPLRIKQELQTKRIDEMLIKEVLQNEQENWLLYAQQVWLKKFKAPNEPSFEELQKQKRFLFNRGFSTELITNLFKDKELKY